jgi:hypothetical protein
MKKALLSLLFTAFLFASCTEAIDKPINAESFQNDLKEIETAYASFYDSTDFAGLKFAVGLGSAFADEKGKEKMAEQTYRQLLDEFKSNREKRERERAEKLAAYEHELAEWKKENERLKKTILAKVTKKGYEEGRYGIEKYLSFTFSGENKTEKPVKAFRLAVIVSDVFDQELGKFSWEYEKDLAPGKSVEETIYYEYNRYKDGYPKMKSSAIKDLKFEWQPLKVIFTDGSSMEMKDEPSRPYDL